MDAYTGYVYAVMWLLIAVYLFYTAIKNSKFLFVLSGFFLFLSGWYLTDELLAVDLLSGVYSYIYRGVAIAVLIVCAIAYARYRKLPKNDDN